MIDAAAAIGAPAVGRAKPDDAFLALLKAQTGTLHKVAWIYGRDAEDRGDLVQEMTLQLWRAHRRFDGRASLSTWTWRVAVNVAISHRRREQRRPPAAPLDQALNVADDGAAPGEETGAAGTLRRLIDGLDEMNRALILLYLEGFDHGEIAQVLGATAGAVATRLGRIKATLRNRAAEASEVINSGGSA